MLRMIKFIIIGFFISLSQIIIANDNIGIEELNIGTYISLGEDLVPVPKSYYVFTFGSIIRGGDIAYDELRLYRAGIIDTPENIIIRQYNHSNEICFDICKNDRSFGSLAEISESMINNQPITVIKYKNHPSYNTAILYTDDYQIMVTGGSSLKLIEFIISNTKKIDQQ